MRTYMFVWFRLSETLIFSQVLKTFSFSSSNKQTSIALYILFCHVIFLILFFFKQTTLDEKNEDLMFSFPFFIFIHVYRKRCSCSERVEVKYFFFIIVCCLRQDFMIFFKRKKNFYSSQRNINVFFYLAFVTTSYIGCVYCENLNNFQQKKCKKKLKL